MYMYIILNIWIHVYMSTCLHAHRVLRTCAYVYAYLCACVDMYMQKRICICVFMFIALSTLAPPAAARTPKGNQARLLSESALNEIKAERLHAGGQLKAELE